MIGTTTGVFLSISPADINDGAKGDAVLAVTFPDDFDLDEYAIVEEGQPPWEWLVPASVLNAVTTGRVLTDEDIDQLPPW